VAVGQLDPGREVAAVPGRQEADNERGWLVAVGGHNRHIGKVATARDKVVVMVPTLEGFILAGWQGIIYRSECNQLFWQGFHPNDHARLLPYLVGRRSTWEPGVEFNFQELFNRVHAIFSQWRHEDEEAKAEDMRQWKLA